MVASPTAAAAGSNSELRWEGILPNGQVVVVELGPALDLVNLRIVAAHADTDGAGVTTMEMAGAEADVTETLASQELRRGVARCVVGALGQGVLEARLQRLVSSWRRARGASALLLQRSTSAAPGRALAGGRPGGRRPGPRLFVDRVGSNAAKVSWVPLGGVGEEAVAFEVEARKFRSGTGRSAPDKEPELESLGSFIAPGAGNARSFTLRRLRSQQWHRIRCRALGRARQWISDWSEEVSLKTLSVAEACAGGGKMTANSFFAPSERRVCGAVCPSSRREAGGIGDNIDDAIMDRGDVEAGGEGGDPGSDLPTADDIRRLRAQLAEDWLGETYGSPIERPAVVKEILDARYCRGGREDFIGLGARYSKPAETREQRMRRLRLVFAAEELYGASYSEGNPWFMGPLYYDMCEDAANGHFGESVFMRGGG